MGDRSTATLVPPAGGNGTGPSPSARSLTRRRTLPGSRAVVGGLLVTASAVGLFAAYGASSSEPADVYVVAARVVEPGQRLSAGDLKLERIDLPAGQRAHAFTRIGVLAGHTVSLNHIEAGELVQSGDVVDAGAGRGKARISVPVEPGNAMGGRALAGELVDVIVTYSVDGLPRTTTVARGVQVSEVLTGDRSLGTSGQLTAILLVDPDQLEAVAQAATSGKVTLAVTTGVQRG